MENESKKSTKKTIVIIIAIICFITLLISLYFAFLNKDNKIANNSNIENGINDIGENEDNIENVIKLMESYSNEIGDINNLSFDLKYDNTYRFDQNYQGIEVVGGGIIVTLEENNIQSIINYNYNIPNNFNTTSKCSREDLINVAKDYYKKDNIELIENKLVISPINDTEFELIHICEFDINTIIISDEKNTVIREYNAFNENNDLSVQNVIKEQHDDFIESKREERENEPSVLEKDNQSFDNTSVTEESLKKYDEVMSQERKYYKASDVDEFMQADGTYKLKDNERNIEVFILTKNQFDSSKDAQKDKKYESVTFSDINDINRIEKNYYAFKAMNNIQDVYDYYLEKFGYGSLKREEEYQLNVFTNLSSIGTDDWRNNACLAYYNENDIRMYFGSDNSCINSFEVFGHEYTHGFFDDITKINQNTSEDENEHNEIKAINEAYADIMGMIIESYYQGTEKIDGVFGDRNIKDVNPKYEEYNQNLLEYHQNSMIVSKVAYLMSTNEKLNLTNDELAQIWFNSIYKLPKTKVTYLDVERAVLLQAKELKYTDDEIKEISNIFTSLGYPDMYNTFESKILNIRIKDYISIEEAKKLLEENYGKHKEVSIDFEYAFWVYDLDDKVNFVFRSYPHDNLGFYGGEWTLKNEEGRYQGENYYVGIEIIDGKVKVNKYAYNPMKPEIKDTIGGFLVKSDVDIVKKEQ